MTLFAALALLLTPQATDPDLPRIFLTGKTGVVWDTPIRKLGVLGDQYSQRLVQYQPGTERIVKSVPLIAGGGGDGSTSLLGNPDQGTFAIQAVSVGMTLEVYRAQVFGPDLNLLPIDADYVYGLDQNGVLVAPDLNRFPDERMGDPGPLTLYDPKTSKMLWRRYDVSTSQSPYSAILYPHYVAVSTNLNTVNPYTLVIDRSTGKTVYSDPPHDLQAGEMTVDPWPNAKPDITHDQLKFVFGLPDPNHSNRDPFTLINTPNHLVIGEHDHKNGGYTFFERDRETNDVIGIAFLSSDFASAYIALVNPLDSPAFALNFYQTSNRQAQLQAESSLVFHIQRPPLKLPDTRVVNLDQNRCVAVQHPQGPSNLLVIDPQTGHTLSKSPELGQFGEAVLNDRTAFVSHALVPGKLTLTALDLKTGRAKWERDIPLSRMILKRNYLLLLDGHSGQALDLANGRTLATFTLKPGVIPDRYKN